MPARTPTLVAMSIGILLVIGLGILVSIGAADAIDHAIIRQVRGPDSALLGFLRPVTELGSTGAVTIVAAIVLVVGIAIGRWRYGALGAAIIGLASIGVELVKLLVARTRPEILEPLIDEHGFAFPSGHATLSMTAYGVLAVLVGRSRLPVAAKVAMEVGAAVVIGLVGLSRVWLGVHHPSDVLAGWIAGAVIVLAYAELTRGASTGPAAAAADGDRGVPRSDPPAAG
ncbi:MAG TPA: phosphatase PAP2 family protein [Candidatus Limnocylindria bacterium]|nr:phosphatase PAP2 family protein [Candidatus Limnocylindria bacterium]